VFSAVSPCPFSQSGCEKYNLKIVIIFSLLLLSRVIKAFIFILEHTWTTPLLSKAHKISKYCLTTEI
jgi:hypothetical protein